MASLVVVLPGAAGHADHRAAPALPRLRASCLQRDSVSGTTSAESSPRPVRSTIASARPFEHVRHVIVAVVQRSAQREEAIAAD